jgi:hypothetical protein
MSFVSSKTAFLATAVAFVSVASAFAATRPMTDEETITNAMSAAPEAVGKNATIVNWDMKVLRKGSNNFTCIPDDPTTPTNDPMCADENGMEWLHAYMAKKPPPDGKIGFGYMLQGESATSNADPFAPPPADGKWSQAGPHVMIFNAKGTMTGYPRPGEHPDATQPFVMYQDTPYEHLMIPTR